MDVFRDEADREVHLEYLPDGEQDRPRTGPEPGRPAEKAQTAMKLGRKWRYGSSGERR
jgi:hypothetical protein